MNQSYNKKCGPCKPKGKKAMPGKKGFTLIELLVVIAIIGILSTMAVVSLSSARSKARDAKRVSDMKQFQTAMEMMYMDETSYDLAEGTTTDCNPGARLAVCADPDLTPTYIQTSSLTDPSNSSTPFACTGSSSATCDYGILEAEATKYTICFYLENPVPNSVLDGGLSSLTQNGLADGCAAQS